MNIWIVCIRLADGCQIFKGAKSLIARQSSGAGGYAEMAADYRLRHDEFESLTPVAERSRSLRDARNSLASVDSMSALSPIATRDDNEIKIKKLKSKLKNVHKLGLSPDKADQMRLELISELDELEADDEVDMANGEDSSSKSEEKAPWM